MMQSRNIRGRTVVLEESALMAGGIQEPAASRPIGSSSSSKLGADPGMRASKSVVITQSNYLPWRGYFDLLGQAEEVILLDSVQYTRRDWRNRNIIKTANGPAWLTIPVEVSGRYNQAIDETRLAAGSGWAKQHRRSIEHAYRRAACYASEAPFLFDLLDRVADEERLSAVNEVTLRALCGRLGLTTAIRHCVDLIDRGAMAAMDPTARLLALCSAAGATRYISGPSARAYLDPDLFAAAGIEVSWVSYEGYPAYRQVGDTFEPKVSVIDLLLNMGDEGAALLRTDHGRGVTGSARSDADVGQDIALAC